MNPINLKLTASLAGIALAVVPPVTYKAADLYMRGYNTASDYLGETKDQALSYVGLTTVKEEASVDKIIEKEALRFHLDPRLLSALVKAESAHNLDAYSPKGAIGLAQIMPANSRRCGHKSASKLWDETNNIRCGAQILSEEIATYKGDLHSALIVYNAGPTGLKQKWSGAVAYANGIMMRYAQAAYRMRS